MINSSNFWFRQPTGIPKNADTIIVGGGITGLLLLSQLCRIDGHSAYIVEECSPAYRASGRNSGVIFCRGQKLFSCLAPEVAEELYTAIKNNNFNFFGALEKSKLPVDIHKGGCLYLADSAEELENLKAEEDFLRRMGQDVASLDGTALRHLIPRGDFLGGFYSGSESKINSFEFCQALKTRVDPKGGKVLSHCSVQAVEYNSDGSMSVDIKNKGVIKTKNLVFCTNGYTGTILSEFKDKIIPCRMQALSTKTLGAGSFEFDAALINNGHASVTKHQNRLIVSGMRGVLKNNQKNDLSDAEISPKVFAAQRELAGRLSPFSSKTFESTWAGIIGWSCDGLPFVGPIPGKPNQFIAAGYGGFGLSQFCQSSLIVKDFIVSGASERAGSCIYNPARLFKDV